MPREIKPTRQTEVRRLRLQLKLSQAQFAKMLGVSAETYRTWDSGRRPVPGSWMDKVREFATTNDPHRLWSLQDLAVELGVHVRTLRDAVRSGRLEVTYGNAVVFRNPVPRTTLDAGRVFMQQYYKQCYSRFASKPPAPTRILAPSDWHRRIVDVRYELRLTQTQLAERIGAASKAVVYQWESRKRRPSPEFWRRIEQLASVGAGASANTKQARARYCEHP